MTLPTTSLSFSALQTEFGGSNPISLSEYIQGGSYVPSGTTSAYGTIPSTTSNINMGVFRGTQKSQLVALSTHSVYASRTAYGQDLYSQSSAFSRLQVTTAGQLIGTGSTSWTAQYVTAEGSILIDGNEYWSDTQAGSTETVTLQNWLTGGGASNYSIRMRIVTGASPNGSTTFRDGTFDTWLPMTSDREFSVTSYSSASNRSVGIAVVCALEIALTSNTSNILQSGTMTLWTQAESYEQQNLE